MKLKIENDYADGHSSTRLVELLDEPAPVLLEDWWEGEVWPLTGDGHDGDAFYTATVVEALDESLVGREREWVG